MGEATELQKVKQLRHRELSVVSTIGPKSRVRVIDAPSLRDRDDVAEARDVGCSDDEKSTWLQYPTDLFESVHGVHQEVFDDLAIENDIKGFGPIRENVFL